MIPTFVLYHSNCPDGFGAAWAAWMALRDDNVTYLPVNYGKPLPEIPDGSRVYIVDFSFPRDVLLKLADRCQVQVLDHHATAQEDLKGLPFATFDMQLSGAALTWAHFHQNDIPPILQYVQDRDLWRWELPHSKEINTALWRCTPRDFLVWQELYIHWDVGITTAKERLIEAGKAIAFSDGVMVDGLCKHPTWQRILCYTVPIVNTPVLQSEIGHELLLRHPNAPFAGTWMTFEDGTISYSLRARSGDFDVSAIAREFGGGGHRAAAGFTCAQPFEIQKKGGQVNEV